MAKKPSKTKKKTVSPVVSAKKSSKTEKKKTGFATDTTKGSSKTKKKRTGFIVTTSRLLKWGKERVVKAKSPHKTFKRTYREDYQRETELPGIMHHIFASFRVIFRNYKLFLPFLILMAVISILLVGLMGESSYSELKDGVERSSAEGTSSVTKAWTMLLFTFSTGGLAGESKEVTMVFSVLIFLAIWLVTIFILRQEMAGHKIKLRDALYNAMTPLFSTLAIFVVVAIECIPFLILLIVYSAAVQTDFLTTPFYTLLFFGFAALMITLSGYLLSSSIIALLATSAPGLYPVVALDASSELMMGRRIRFVIRLGALILTALIMWIVVMMPLILFDMFMKQFAWTSEIPFIPIRLVIMTCFTEIYVTTYLYKYYRYLLEHDS